MCSKVSQTNQPNESLRSSPPNQLNNYSHQESRNSSDPRVTPTKQANGNIRSIPSNQQNNYYHQESRNTTPRRSNSYTPQESKSRNRNNPWGLQSNGTDETTRLSKQPQNTKKTVSNSASTNIQEIQQIENNPESGAIKKRKDLQKTQEKNQQEKEEKRKEKHQDTEINEAIKNMITMMYQFF